MSNTKRVENKTRETEMTTATATATATQYYIVIVPGRKNTENIELVTDNKERAIEIAKKCKSGYVKKGWDSWAKKVSVRLIKTSAYALKIHNQLIQLGNTMDMYNQGSRASMRTTMSMDTCYHWAGLLKKAYLENA